MQQEQRDYINQMSAELEPINWVKIIIVGVLGLAFAFVVCGAIATAIYSLFV